MAEVSVGRGHKQQYCCSSTTAPRRDWSSSTCLPALSSFDNYSSTLETAGVPVHKVAGIRSSGPVAQPRIRAAEA